MASNLLSSLPQHYVLRRGQRYLFDASGRTVSTPYPLAKNFCVKAEADDLAQILNSGLPEGAALFTVEPLDLAAIAAAEVDLTGEFMGSELQEAA